MTKKLSYFVKGMHCTACEIFIEKKISNIDKIKFVKADLVNNKLTIEIDEKEKIETDDINKLFKGTGYKISENEFRAPKLNYIETGKALIISIIFLSIFIILQKTGLLNFINTNELNYSFIFLIGIVASLSTCMAVVGGIALSISSTSLKQDNKNYIPLINFHISRLIGFFLLGGIIGVLGSAFTLTPSIIFILNILLFLAMLILGIDLLDIFPIVRNLEITMPKIIGEKVINLENKKNKLTPIILGAATFFLPCGFTQSMQIYSLTTGNFLNGALTMLIFALGTFPILALISFASVKFANSLRSSLFFKTSGFIIVFFAILNFIGALTAIGLIPPFLNI
jgi:sulfite exporter TauE/SafE/copper chaperone CopZ